MWMSKNSKMYTFGKPSHNFDSNCTGDFYVSNKTFINKFMIKYTRRN